jgi:hypothetical protein
MNALVIHPGDTLIIVSQDPISDAQAAFLNDRLRQEIPEEIRIIILDSISGMAVVRTSVEREDHA